LILLQCHKRPGHRLIDPLWPEIWRDAASSSRHLLEALAGGVWHHDPGLARLASLARQARHHVLRHAPALAPLDESTLDSRDSVSPHADVSTLHEVSPHGDVSTLHEVLTHADPMSRAHAALSKETHRVSKETPMSRAHAALPDMSNINNDDLSWSLILFFRTWPSRRRCVDIPILSIMIFRY